MADLKDLDLATLEHCLKICDYALEHYKGNLTAKIRREIALIIREKKNEQILRADQAAGRDG